MILVQPSRQTRHSDPDLSFATLAARTDFYSNGHAPFMRRIRSGFSQITFAVGPPNDTSPRFSSYPLVSPSVCLPRID